MFLYLGFWTLVLQLGTFSVTRYILVFRSYCYISIIMQQPLVVLLWDVSLDPRLVLYHFPSLFRSKFQYIWIYIYIYTTNPFGRCIKFLSLLYFFHLCFPEFDQHDLIIFLGFWICIKPHLFNPSSTSTRKTGPKKYIYL